MKTKTRKVIKHIKWCWKSFCVSFVYNRKHLIRDLVIVSTFVVSLGTVWVTGWYIGEKALDNNFEQPNILDTDLSEQGAIDRERRKISDAQAHFDTSSWTPYQNIWYGMALKYPSDWSDPIVQKPVTGAMWDQKIQFRLKETDDRNPFEGFDVKVYSVWKVKELANTDEFPKLKNVELSSEEECSNIEGHLLETGDYPAEEIYIPASDACYDAALFFSNTRDAYIYTFFPKFKDGAGLAGDPTQEIVNHIPEFFATISTWNLIDIQRPKPASTKPKTTAPMPVSYIVVNGRNVCAKNGDKPGKSNQGKSKHMDMECCLDPDEYPNPHCYYDPAKYGKYL